MQTVCPICHTIFRVAATALHDTDGMVQCGVCGMVFNAHAHWIATTTPLVTSSIVPDSSESDHEVADGGMDSDSAAEALVAPREQSAESDFPATIQADHAMLAESSETGADLDTALEHSRPFVPPMNAAAESGPVSAIVTESASVTSIEDRDQVYLPPSAHESAIVTDEPAHPDLAKQALTNEDSTDEATISATPVNFLPFRRKRRPLLFSVLSSGLMVMLLLQIGYLYRNRLVSQFPRFKPAAASLCKVLGCRIAVPRSIDALKISSSELIADPAQSKLIHVSFGLENLSDIAVAYPSISLTLFNDAGEIVVKRNFTSRDYASSSAVTSGIAPDDEIAGNLTLKLDQISVSNYKLLLFYP